MKKVCVLRSGGDFKPKHVQWLADQIPGLVCLSDVPVDGVETIRLRHKWPKWWAKMELFSDILDEDLLYFDLDTVIVGDISEFECIQSTTVLRDFYRPQLMGSGLMYIAQQDKAQIWEAWMKNPKNHMMLCNSWPMWGDQGFLQNFIGDAQKWQDVLPSRVVSYKVHCQLYLPTEASIVCFHGNPRPWNVNDDWVPALL